MISTISDNKHRIISRKKPNNRYLILSFILLIVFSGTLLSQSFNPRVNIQGISIEEKANGTLIRIRTNGEVSQSQITAWTSKTNWFYVTILNGVMDTSLHIPFARTGLIKEFQQEQLVESVQLNFKLTRMVENFNIDVDNQNEINITLRLPLDEVLASIEELKSSNGKEITIEPKRILPVLETVIDRVPFALMFTGSALFITGLIDSNSKEMGIGVALLASGFMLNIHNQKPQEIN